MNRYLTIKISCFCVAYTDVGEEREQESGSFVKLRNSLAITCVSRLEPEHFNQQSIRPRLNPRFLAFSSITNNIIKYKVQDTSDEQ